MTRHRAEPILFATLVCILVPSLFVAVYGGSYAYMVKRPLLRAFDSEFGDWYEPEYPIESPAIEYFFWPAHLVDCRMRPEYWQADSY